MCNAPLIYLHASSANQRTTASPVTVASTSSLTEILVSADVTLDIYLTILSA